MKYIQSDIKLTIGILVSNRIKYIRDVMEALKPLLEAVPSELIAVDTKGADSDGSIEVVREYTDKVYSFTWCDDFSAARNVTLEHASGEWYMFLDDDEVFDDVSELITFFTSGEYRNYGAGYYQVRNYRADGGQRTAIVGRMVRRTEKTRFVGRIHEAFNEVHEPYKFFSCFAHHYGYYFETEEARKQHQERNVTLLRKELAVGGITPRVCAQLMQELLSCEETADSGYELFIKTIDEVTKKKDVSDGCTQWMLVASVRYFKIKKDYLSVLSQADDIRRNYALNPVTQMALAGAVIEAAVKESDIHVILAYAHMYRLAWKWLQSHEDEAIPQTQLDFTNYITEKYAVQVFQAAATCANAQEDYQTAYEYWQLLPWGNAEFDGAPYLERMQETLNGLERTAAKEKVEDVPEQTKKIGVMKRLTREEMLGILVTLQKANRLTGAPDTTEEQVISILTKCQDSAITLGEALERYGEIGEQIIHLLEEYCEAIYQQSQMLNNAEVQKEFRSGIAALLGMVEEKITKELPKDKKVVVFLPYKAAMWDSLESVWKAADEDESCEAYVVPIPYYDRNSDQSFGEMHYEGQEYPSYVPITSWEEFSIPDMKPDQIYIHNPYDELNFVTSVHPMFYASNLKNYTKELVYIPYFVLDDKHLDRPEMMEQVEHFCMQPGVIHSHKVIVQSEAMKDAYVKVLVEKFGEETRADWEAKILGLGSPKFDKVNHTTEGDFDIPESWKKILYKSDGSRKKVILYNTSVKQMLDYQEKMIDKIRRAFEIFREHGDEVALLWRPHPLTQTTLDAMRPRLSEEYKELVTEYRAADFGIYDDTSDLNRAIALADAYYGDGSSLVQLCQEKGMPVMVQNVDI